MEPPQGVIGNNPGFNPAQAGRRRRGLRRGRRFWLMLLGGVFVFTAGLVVVQMWASSWRHPAEAKLEVEQNTAKLPPFKIDASLPTSVAAPVAAPVATPAPPPPREPPRIERATPMRGSPQARRKELPQAMTWNVSVQGEPPSDWLADGRRPMIAKGCALRPGASLIPAALNTVVDSGVTPGQVIATTTEDVFDVDGVGRLLIPQGTKVVGVYQNALQFGQLRLGIVWTEATEPDGTQITLADANGMDVAGSMGMGGEVSTNWGQILAVAAIFTVFDAAQRATVPDDDSYSSSLADASANQFSRVGSKVVSKILDSAITIRIPAGTQLTISVGKTLQLC